MIRILLGYKKNNKIHYILIDSDKSVTSWKISLYDKGYDFFKNEKLKEIDIDKLIELDWGTAIILDGDWMRYIDKHSYKLPYKLRDSKLP